MPLTFYFLLFTIILILIIIFSNAKVFNFSRTASEKIDVLLLIFSVFSLIISVKLFWNLAVYTDDFGATIKELFGGYFWLYMNC